MRDFYVFEWGEGWILIISLGGLHLLTLSILFVFWH
jgi:hypothetical protein